MTGSFTEVMPLSHCSADPSDEQSACRADIIQVLCRDNGNWWSRRLANGEKGCFTANCMAGGLEDGQLCTIEADNISTQTEAMDSPGELSFISEHDTDSETSDTTVHKQKKKKKTRVKKSESPAAPTPACITAVNPAVPGNPGRRMTPKTTDRPLPKTGQTNRAFEPDFEP
ncbi:hypothetical protein JZ751_005239 [Albula glossodonta]|uniref:Uncharacterized protein n=1 Tax=Albula glossodonta TaxID=121402 RepID=A0A8T2PFV9_9TELE|nr:hypothetical protein JZ751_005239 [Albula glossodonta]